MPKQIAADWLVTQMLTRSAVLFIGVVAVWAELRFFIARSTEGPALAANVPSGIAAWAGWIAAVVSIGAIAWVVVAFFNRTKRLRLSGPESTAGMLGWAAVSSVALCLMAFFVPVLIQAVVGAFAAA